MAYKTISIKDYSGIRNEATAAEAITPGQMVELTSAGKVQKQSTAGGFAEKAFALEDELQGKEIGDAYASASIVQYGIFNSGDEVYAWLKDGETIVIGDKLTPDGTGQLQKLTADSSGVVVEEHPVAIALEALDLSNSAVAAGRIPIRII